MMFDINSENLIAGRRKGCFTVRRSTLTILLLVFIAESQAAIQIPTIERKVIKHDQPEALVGFTMQDEKDFPLFYDTFYPLILEVPYKPIAAPDATLQVPKNVSSTFEALNDVNGHLCSANRSSSPLPPSASRAGLSSSPFLEFPPLPFGLNNATDQWENNLCPIKRKLDELVKSISKELNVFETFNASISKLDSHFKSCHEIKPHFSNHIIDSLEMELYLVQVILDCPMSDMIHAKINIPPLKKQKYEEIFQLFLETYIMPRFRLFGFPKFAIPTNTLLALQSSFLLNALLEAFQWTTSINTCNSQRIPRLLVPQKVLLPYLKEIQSKVAEKGFNLTIPIWDISNYYKMKLTDCIMTSDNDYIIRVLVPLRKTNANYRLIKMNSIPFMNKDTKSEKITICYHRSLEGSFIVEGKNQLMKPVVQTEECQPAELCRVPPDGDRSLFPKCVRSSFSNSTQAMLESCRMSCVPYDHDDLPYIKRIRSDQFIIVGNVTTGSLTVNCKKDDPIPVEGIPDYIGSLLITLPCSCYISYRSRKFEVNGPCEFNLEFRPVRPKGYTYDSLLDHYFHHRLLNISKSIAKEIANTTTGSDGDGIKPATPAFLDEGEEGEYFNLEDYQCPKWPIYLAYFLLMVIVIFMVFGFYVLRNVYVRIGQMEMTTALTPGNGVTPSRRYQSGPQYHRNAAVAFNVRDSFPPIGGGECVH